MNLVLIGYRGSGKTTVGRAVAALLGWRFLDLDSDIEARAGCCVSDIFRRHGEPHFRSLESAVLAESLRGGHLVLAPGGGVILAEANRTLLRRPGTVVVYLNAPPEVVFDRTRRDPASVTQRPALTPSLDLETEIRAVFAARLPIYRGLMTDEVDASLPVERVAAEVVAILHRQVNDPRMPPQD